MIPKVIHYCWFGRNPLPALAIRCINSWKKYLPGYEIKEWNEDNFDVNMIPYTKEAYEAKKYAFVSDYARFWILYHYGGVYFDTDVEIIKEFTSIVKSGNFMGKEIGNPIILNDGTPIVNVNPGLGMGAEKGDPFLKEALAIYQEKAFLLPDGSLNTKTIVSTTTEMLIAKGYCSNGGVEIVDGWKLYPEDYFCPKNYYTGELCITENSYSIHHYDASWKSKSDKRKKCLVRILPNWLTRFIIKIKHII